MKVKMLEELVSRIDGKQLEAGRGWGPWRVLSPCAGGTGPLTPMCSLRLPWSADGCPVRVILRQKPGWTNVLVIPHPAGSSTPC